MDVPDAHVVSDSTVDKDDDTRDKETSKETDYGGGLLVVSTNPNDWTRVLTLHHPSLAKAIGIHPWFVTSDHAKDLEAMAELLRDFTELRVGEIGLDKSGRHKATYSSGLQTIVFERQLALAGEHQRSVSIHCVQSHGRLLDVLRELDRDLSRPVPRGVYLHSWSGSPDVTRDILRLKRVGPVIFFGVSLKINASRREIIEAIPLDRLLVESDLQLNDPDRLRAMAEVVKLLVTIISPHELVMNFERFLNLMSKSS